MTAPLDLIVVNARIATGNPRRPWATALALRANTLAALGPAAELVKMAQPTTKVLDANGAELTLPDGAAIGAPLTVVETGSTLHVEFPSHTP